MCSALMMQSCEMDRAGKKWSGSGATVWLLGGSLLTKRHAKVKTHFILSAPTNSHHSPTSIHFHHTTAHICPPPPHLLKPSRVHGNRATGLHQKHMQINSWPTQSCELCTEVVGQDRRWLANDSSSLCSSDLNIAHLTQTGHRHHHSEQDLGVAKWPQAFP